MKRRSFVPVLAGLLLTAAAVVSAQPSSTLPSEFLDDPSAQALVAVFDALRSGYLTDVDGDRLIRGAINGMISSLDDPFSYYVEPKSAALETQDRSGSFVGVGVQLTPHDRRSGEGVEILTVYKGGPADEAGLRRGDVFLEVDGSDVRTMSIGDVADLVRGPKGVPVELTMLRPGQDEPLTFSIARDTIEIIDVQSTVLDDHVGYVALSSFDNEQLYDQLVEQLDALQRQGITSLVLDLRDNQGGLVTQAILVADEFLSQGAIVFERSSGLTRLRASADPHAFSLPMVVLVNRNSMSSTEIVAAALQANGRAKVVGETTFGKGVLQKFVSLPDGGLLWYVATEWLTPDRDSIHKKGITPDVEARDTRFPNTVSIEGSGAYAGQTIEVTVDGHVIGTTEAEDDGTFGFVTLGPRPATSGVQGEALVDLANDSALQTAVATVLAELERSKQAANVAD